MRARDPLRRRRRVSDRRDLRSAAKTTDPHGRRAHRVGQSPREVISLQRALAKPHVRVIGIDDGAFGRDQKTAPLVGVVLSTPTYVEAIVRSRVTIDGTDATERIIALVEHSGHQEGIRGILLDGIAVGGFNVVDLDAVYERLQIPVVSVTPRAPNFERIRAALLEYFPADFARRWAIVRAHRLYRVPIGSGTLRATGVGCSRREASALVLRTTILGHWPEPLRLAHLVARAGFHRRRLGVNP
ncbi:MAG: DUF99 family protein [Thermoplasmata archaeon]